MATGGMPVMSVLSKGGDAEECPCNGTQQQSTQQDGIVHRQEHLAARRSEQGVKNQGQQQPHGQQQAGRRQGSHRKASCHWYLDVQQDGCTSL